MRIVSETISNRLQIAGPKQSLMGNGTQGKHNLQTAHCGKFGLQVAVALTDFRGAWLIGRR